MSPLKPQQEIQREPEIPPLTERAIEILSTLCFRENDPISKTDLLFVFGTRKNIPEASEQVRTLLDADITTRVLLTGGPTQGYETQESTLLLSAIDPMRYPNVTFLCEKTSTNTMENVGHALPIYDLSQLASVTFVFKAYAAGRGYLTLRKATSDSRILQAAYPVSYPGTNGPLTAENWHRTTTGIKRVWGEFERIRLYGRRGDIAYEEVRKQVEEVEHQLRL